MEPSDRRFRTSPVVFSTAAGVLFGALAHLPAAIVAWSNGYEMTIVPVFLIIGAFGGAAWGLHRASDEPASQG